MVGRTYRYFKGDVRYPFGHGLSYTTFSYSPLTAPDSVTTGHDATVSVTVKNTGKREGDEVVQLYVSHSPEGRVSVPVRSLKGFRRVSLKPGESRKVSFTLTPEELGLVDNRGNLVMAPGSLQIYIGGGQPFHSAGNFADLIIKGEPYTVY